MFESEAELRRIRITLVWIAVFLLFGACGNQDTIIETDSGNSDTMKRLSPPRFHLNITILALWRTAISKFMSIMSPAMR